MTNVLIFNDIIFNINGLFFEKNNQNIEWNNIVNIHNDFHKFKEWN